MVPERPNTEDIIINKKLGKRLTRDEEFVFEFEKQEKTREVKRRLLQRSSNGNLALDSFPDFTMIGQAKQEEQVEDEEMPMANSDSVKQKESEKENQEPVKEEERQEVQE